MKRTLMAGVLALAAWSAQGAPDVPGWRIGAAASFSDFDWDEGSTNLISDSTVGAKLHVQYQFNDWFAIEGAYHNTGEFSDDVVNSADPNVPDGNYDLSFTGFSAAAVGYLPWPGDEVQFYGKVGYFDFDDELSLENVVTSTGSENGVMAGFGANVDVADRFGLRVDFDWFDVDVGDVWSINMGFEFFFGGSRSGSAAAAPPPPPPAE